MPAVAAATSASTTSRPSPSTTTRTTTPSAISASVRWRTIRRASISRAYWPIAIEVRLIIRKISAAFDGKRRRTYFAVAFGDGFCNALASTFHCAIAATHLRALLFENGLARKPDAIALDGQHLHQHLIAFLQLVANIFNPMLRNFADVQQSIGPGNDLDKSSEIRQPRDLSAIRLAHLGRRR